MLQSVYFEVKNVQDKHDLKQMKKGLDTLYGVLSVSVNQKEHRVGVDYDTTGVTGQQIEDYLNDRGYTVTNVQTSICLFCSVIVREHSKISPKRKKTLAFPALANSGE